MNIDNREVQNKATADGKLWMNMAPNRNKIERVHIKYVGYLTQRSNHCIIEGGIRIRRHAIDDVKIKGTKEH